jgi:hypothetical protein
MSKQLIKAGPGLLPDKVNALNALADSIREDFSQADLADRDLSFRNIRIGVRLIQAKSLIPHGGFDAWRKKEFTEARERKCRYSMSLAQSWIEQQQVGSGDLRVLLEGGEKKAESKVEQLLLEFIGGRTQAELLSDLGIRMSDKKKTGGANMLNQWLRAYYPKYEGTSIGRLPEKIQAEWSAYCDQRNREKYGDTSKAEYNARRWWDDILAELHQERTTAKRYQAVDLATLRRISGLLLDLKRTIDDTIAKG